jgi:5-methylcytosine-specific restriction endonuclease McrA
MSDLTKNCRACGKNKPISDFSEWAPNKLRSICEICRVQRDSDSHKNIRKDPPKNKKLNERRRAWRQKPENRSTVIYQDSKASDRKRLGLLNDLTKEFIYESIKNGCSYCGETELQITLDRIDNNLPHNQNNVVSACVRCNLIRGDMPSNCWMHLVPSIKSAYELGLFHNWQNKFHRKN